MKTSAILCACVAVVAAGLTEAAPAEAASNVDTASAVDDGKSDITVNPITIVISPVTVTSEIANGRTINSTVRWE